MSEELDNSPIIPEPLSGLETSNIAAHMYEIAGAKIGTHLVEANVVLTLAGARGQTEFYIKHPTQEDVERINKMNDAVSEKGMRIQAVGQPHTPDDGQKMLMVSIRNLRGYERSSHLTKFLGIKPFNATSGWKGLALWNHELRKMIIMALREKRLPYPSDAAQTIQIGIHKGYPDQAILDYCDWLAKEKSPYVAEADIPLVDMYGGATPAFDYYPEHQNDQGIQSTLRTWNKVLEDFYASPWHQHIKNNASFIAAREEMR